MNSHQSIMRHTLWIIHFEQYIRDVKKEYSGKKNCLKNVPPFVPFALSFSWTPHNPCGLNPPTSISDQRFTDLVNNQRRWDTMRTTQRSKEPSSWSFSLLQSLAGELELNEPGWKCNSDALFPSIPGPIPSLIPSILWTSEPKLHVFLTQSLMGEKRDTFGHILTNWRPEFEAVSQWEDRTGVTTSCDGCHMACHSGLNTTVNFTPGAASC